MTRSGSLFGTGVFGLVFVALSPIPSKLCSYRACTFLASESNVENSWSRLVYESVKPIAWGTGNHQETGTRSWDFSLSMPRVATNLQQLKWCYDKHPILVVTAARSNVIEGKASIASSG